MSGEREATVRVTMQPADTLPETFKVRSAFAPMSVVMETGVSLPGFEALYGSTRLFLGYHPSITNPADEKALPISIYAMNAGDTPTAIAKGHLIF